MMLFINGVEREATPEEELLYKVNFKEKITPPVNPKAKMEERIVSIEQSQLDLAEAIATIYEGGTA